MAKLILKTICAGMALMTIIGLMGATAYWLVKVFLDANGVTF